MKSNPPRDRRVHERVDAIDTFLFYLAIVYNPAPMAHPQAKKCENNHTKDAGS